MHELVLLQISPKTISSSDLSGDEGGIGDAELVLEVLDELLSVGEGEV